jgi:hypothetical protein
MFVRVIGFLSFRTVSSQAEASSAKRSSRSLRTTDSVTFWCRGCLGGLL